MTNETKIKDYCCLTYVNTGKHDEYFHKDKKQYECSVIDKEQWESTQIRLRTSLQVQLSEIRIKSAFTVDYFQKVIDLCEAIDQDLGDFYKKNTMDSIELKSNYLIAKRLMRHLDELVSDIDENTQKAGREYVE